MEDISWTELVKRYRRRVFAVALSVLKNVEDAEEVAQEVFVKLYTHMDGIRKKGSLPSWLARTSYNTAINKLLKSKVRGLVSRTERAEDIPSQGKSPEERLHISQEMEKVKAWRKARLSRKENVVLQLKLGEGMTFQEIADFLRSSPSSVKTHYYRAKDKIDRLAKEADDES